METEGAKKKRKKKKIKKTNSRKYTLIRRKSYKH